MRALKLSDIQPFLLTPFRHESELLEAVEEISRKFTTQRDLIADYLKDPRLVSAYTAFYLTTNVPKLEAVLKWLPPAWIAELKGCDFIDLGSGPGTFSVAWKLLGGEGVVHQIEQSPLMREQGKKLWEGLFPDKLIQGARWSGTGAVKKFLLFGHSANEMGVEAAIRYIKEIAPDHILFIEPGTKEFFEKMLEIRAWLIHENYQVLYPCPRPDGCPMHGTNDWCHQFIHVRQDDEVERLSQKLRLDRKLLPLTVQAFSRTFSIAAPEERMVRVLPETKFSFEWEVCHANVLEHYQIMKRDLSKPEIKALGQILAGEAIVTEVLRKVEQTKRVKIHEILKF